MKKENDDSYGFKKRFHHYGVQIYAYLQSALEQIIKDECIDIRLPLDWTGKVVEKDEKDSRRRAKEKEAIERKKGGTRESKDV